MKSLQNFMIPFYKNIKLVKPDVLHRKTILITGSNGLIGGNLLAYFDYLSEKNNLQLSIIGVSRSKKEPWLPNSHHINYIKEDLTQGQLKALSFPFDYCIHAATYAQPKKILANPRQTVALNIHALFNILEQSKKNKARVLYISSSEIYGETNNKKPALESYFGSVNTLSDRAIYAESKRLAESICYQYHRTVSITIARILLSYGPGVKYDDKRVYSEFIRQAQTTGKITMMNAGRAKRAFCFITDTIEMVINCMLSGTELVYNIAGQDSTTISELAQKIAHLNNSQFMGYTNKNQEISGTPINSIISNSRYCSEFQKKTFVGFSEGLQAISSWFKNIK